jgi:hypothetical protein
MNFYFQSKLLLPQKIHVSFNASQGTEIPFIENIFNPLQVLKCDRQSEHHRVRNRIENQ